MKVELKPIIEQLSEAVNLPAGRRVSALIDDDNNNEIAGWCIVKVDEDGTITPIKGTKVNTIKELLRFTDAKDKANTVTETSLPCDYIDGVSYIFYNGDVLKIDDYLGRWMIENSTESPYDYSFKLKNVNNWFGVKRDGIYLYRNLGYKFTVEEINRLKEHAAKSDSSLNTEDVLDFLGGRPFCSSSILMDEEPEFDFEKGSIVAKRDEDCFYVVYNTYGPLYCVMKFDKKTDNYLGLTKIVGKNYKRYHPIADTGDTMDKVDELSFLNCEELETEIMKRVKELSNKNSDIPHDKLYDEDYIMYHETFTVVVDGLSEITYAWPYGRMGVWTPKTLEHEKEKWEKKAKAGEPFYNVFHFRTFEDMCEFYFRNRWLLKLYAVKLNTKYVGGKK